MNLDGVAHVNDKGGIDQYVFPESISTKWKAQSRVVVRTVDANNNLVPDVPTFLETHTKMALTDQAVRRALRMWRVFARDWVNLYKILEVVQSDVGGKITKNGWATSLEIERFKHTANSYLAIGDESRHAN